MTSKRLEITVSEDTWERLEELRGHEPRASFVKRALESALEFEERLPVPPEPYKRAPSEPSPKPVVSKSREGSRRRPPAPVEAGVPTESFVGKCPKATCQQAGLVGGTCPDHRNLRFKA